MLYVTTNIIKWLFKITVLIYCWLLSTVILLLVLKGIICC